MVGGAIARTTHQFFGTNAVPVGCVSDVCIRPDWRGRGIAKELVDALVDQLRLDDVPLSTLWTPAPGVYRRWGWEVAGLGRRWSIGTSALRSLSAGTAVLMPGFVEGTRQLQRERG